MSDTECDISIIPGIASGGAQVRVYCITCNETVVSYPFGIIKARDMLEAMRSHMDYARLVRARRRAPF